MSMLKKICILLSINCLFAASAWADDAKATQAEAKALAEKAAAYVKSVGEEKAFNEFTNDPKWKYRDTYVYSMDFSGKMTSHGSTKGLVGKELMDLKDSNGLELTKALIGAAKNKGSGWVDYTWTHPATKKFEAKTAYVIRIPGADGFVAAAVYK
jgi:methyl-accepting chemotaxis protein